MISLLTGQDGNAVAAAAAAAAASNGGSSGSSAAAAAAAAAASQGRFCTPNHTLVLLRTEWRLEKLP